MQTYFFDLVGQSRSEYDYRGRKFSDQRQAFQLAQLIAHDLEVDGADEMAGWSVNVRSIDGQKIFEIPIRDSDLVAGYC
ncbi:MAG TPA: hypothetical protein VH249_17750 [Xanthobacteraceae bacterium]|jgi:hypothetical protein|nr:hypothetical protein [Xanthobacteraceae bacterium]